MSHSAQAANEPRSPDSFEAVLSNALAAANLAPSSHNSQPWALGFIKGRARSQAALRSLGRDRREPSRRSKQAVRSLAPEMDHPETSLLALALDRERELNSLPTHALEMSLSCGMYLYLLIEAFGLQGWTARAVWRNDDDRADQLDLAGWPETWHPLVILAVAPSRLDHRLPPQTACQELLRSARQRITNRAPFEEARTRPVPWGEIEQLSSETTGLRSAQLPADMQLTMVREADQIRQLGRFVARHSAIDFAHGPAWKETYRYIRFSKAQMRDAEDGFAITQLFGPLSGLRRTFLRLSLAPPTMAVLKHLGQARAIAHGLGQLVAQTPGLILLGTTTKRPTPSTLVSAGAYALDLWLGISQLGLAMHPISVVLQHDEIREKLEDSLGLSSRTILFCRVGYPTAEMPPSYRRSDPSACVRQLLQGS